MPNGATATRAAAGIDEIAETLRGLRDELRLTAGDGDDASVANMRAYLALRGHDNRPLQAALARLGLSSLGRSEAHVLATLEQVLAIVERLAEDAPTAAASFDETGALLRRRARALFGAGHARRETRIMVTLPSEAASDRDLVRSLTAAGMDAARINSAHDDLAAWIAMAAHIRAASDDAGRGVPSLVDLPGPKLRTGPIEPGPRSSTCGRVTTSSGRWSRPATGWRSPTHGAGTATSWSAPAPPRGAGSSPGGGPTSSAARS